MRRAHVLSRQSLTPPATTCRRPASFLPSCRALCPLVRPQTWPRWATCVNIVKPQRMRTGIIVALKHSSRSLQELSFCRPGQNNQRAQTLAPARSGKLEGHGQRRPECACVLCPSHELVLYSIAAQSVNVSKHVDTFLPDQFRIERFDEIFLGTQFHRLTELLNVGGLGHDDDRY